MPSPRLRRASCFFLDFLSAWVSPPSWHSSMLLSNPSGRVVMADGRFVISHNYGQLVEGWQSAQDALLQAIQAAATRICNAHEIATYAHERAQWAACMSRCPVFLANAE